MKYYVIRNKAARSKILAASLYIENHATIAWFSIYKERADRTVSPVTFSSVRVINVCALVLKIIYRQDHDTRGDHNNTNHAV